MEDGQKLDVVNHDPSFGSSLLSDNFGQRPTDDDITSALDPLKLEANLLQDSTVSAGDRATSSSEEGASPLDDPLLRNPDGATQRFTDMHGKSGEVGEGAVPSDDMLLANTGMRNMAALTVGTRKLGNTDWGIGTDCGRTDKPESDGVPYGSFAGV